MAEVLRLSPDVCVYPDDTSENATVEVVLPGVEKKDISFKLSDNGFYIKATREGVEYAATYAFCCAVEPEKAVAKYSNGLLKVTVPYKQIPEKIVKVKID